MRSKSGKIALTSHPNLGGKLALTFGRQTCAVPDLVGALLLGLNTLYAVVTLVDVVPLLEVKDPLLEGSRLLEVEDSLAAPLDRKNDFSSACFVLKSEFDSCCSSSSFFFLPPLSSRPQCRDTAGMNPGS